MSDGEPPAIRETVIKAALATVPYAGGALAVIYEDVRARRLARVEELVQDIADRSGVERLVRRLTDSLEVEALFVEAIDIAARSAFVRKRELLTKVVAAAVEDDARIEPAQLMVLALRDLDAPHVRALARLHAAESAAKQRQGEETGPQGEQISAAVMEAGRREPVPVIATLVRTGVVHQATLLGGGLAAYSVSDFGRELLADSKCRATTRPVDATAFLVNSVAGPHVQLAKGSAELPTRHAGSIDHVQPPNSRAALRALRQLRPLASPHLFSIAASLRGTAACDGTRWCG